MKTILSLLFALTLGTAFGQFIPQPMGYNPDENGDEFIGLTDLMSMLALYGNAFDNGDSLSTLTVEFSQASIASGGAGTWVNKYDVPEGIDVLYVHAVDLNDVYFNLPQGAGFHSLLIIGTSDVVQEQGTDFKFYVPPTLAYAIQYADNPVEVLQMRAHEYLGIWRALLRAPSGTWLRDGGY